MTVLFCSTFSSKVKVYITADTAENTVWTSLWQPNDRKDRRLYERVYRARDYDAV